MSQKQAAPVAMKDIPIALVVPSESLAVPIAEPTASTAAPQHFQVATVIGLVDAQPGVVPTNSYAPPWASGAAPGGHLEYRRHCGIGTLLISVCAFPICCCPIDKRAVWIDGAGREFANPAEFTLGDCGC
jgi:hypothetical protein